MNCSCLSRKSSLTPVWNVWIASTARSYRAWIAAWERVRRALVCASSPWRSFRARAMRPGPPLAGLHGEHRCQPNHSGHQSRSRGRYLATIPPRPSACQARHWLAPPRDRFIGHPPIKVVGQRPARCVPLFRSVRHGLEADCLESGVDLGVELARRPEVALLDCADHVDHIAHERRPTGQHAVECRTQAINIGPWRPCRSSLPSACSGLMGRGAQGAAVERLGTAAGRVWHQQALARIGARLDLAHRFGQPPIDDQGLAVTLSQDDIRGFDVAVNHSGECGIVDGVAGVREVGGSVCGGREVATTGCASSRPTTPVVSYEG